MSEGQLHTIACRDGCGSTVPAHQIEGSGWELLPVQGRWRCAACWRALQLANTPAEPAEAEKGAA